MTVESFRRGSRSDVIRLALISRAVVLGGMMLSDTIIPDHNPGDDVLRFDLRLSGGGDHNNDGGVGGERRCFCLEGHACDNRSGGKLLHRLSTDGKRRKNIATIDSNDMKGRVCAAASSATLGSTTPTSIDNVYKLMLSPLACWDGARFLTLSVDPVARIPKDFQLDSTKGNSYIMGDVSFADSEQSHAFLPLFPLCIRYIALCLVRIVPSTLLPSTFEGVTTLSAMLLNLTCFVIAALSLYEATRLLLRRSREGLKQSEVERAAYLVATLFCFNPASVFFTASYSESIFASLTFCGHALTAWGSLLMATVPWILATYARSNGTFSSIWILLHGVGQVAALSISEWKASANADIPIAKKIWRVSKCISPTMIIHAIMAVAVALPVLYHERRGYEFHCTYEETLRPSWCELAAESSSRFSLYGYVQRKHWNVGFLHYYEWKQIPNFLLAFPVLALGVMATFCWIGTSWSRYLSAKHSSRGETRPKDGYFIELIKWAIFALDESAQGEAGSIENERDVQEGDTPSVKIDRALSAPYMLAHYAILAGFCLVGATVAHVQVSTRLICSSCPAFYWFLASLCFAGGESMVWRMKVYLAVFNFLGIVLHPNFLPWT